jgi:DNA modification methylase
LELWTNEGDTVLSPFAGIGSEGVACISKGRRFIGTELHPIYWKQGANNLRNAKPDMDDLFAVVA